MDDPFYKHPPPKIRESFHTQLIFFFPPRVPLPWLFTNGSCLIRPPPTPLIPISRASLFSVAFIPPEGNTFNNIEPRPLTRLEGLFRRVAPLMSLLISTAGEVFFKLPRNTPSHIFPPIIIIPFCRFLLSLPRTLQLAKPLPMLF